MKEIQTRLLSHDLMKLLAVPPSPITPTGDGSLIESEGVDNGLNRSPIREQRNHDDNEIRWLAQPFYHSSTPLAKRVTTTSTAIALPLAIMDANIALSDLASCGTRQVWAKLSGRLHRLAFGVLHIHPMPWTVAFFKSPLLFHRLVGLYRCPHRCVMIVR
jgi:hypothetical protein